MIMVMFLGAFIIIKIKPWLNTKCPPKILLTNFVSSLQSCDASATADANALASTALLSPMRKTTGMCVCTGMCVFENGLLADLFVYVDDCGACECNR